MDNIPATASGLNIHGEDGQPRPVISGSTSGDILRLGEANTLRHVEIVQNFATESALQTADGATVSDVVLTGGNMGKAFVAFGDAVLRDSVAQANGVSDGAILAASQQPASTLRLRNVTAIATGAGAVAVRAASSKVGGCAAGCVSHIDAVNVIARGEIDLQAFTDDATAPASINIGNSNYRPATVDPQVNGSGRFINDLGSNQSADPLFANAAGGDFHQLPGSPTIDAGTADPFNGFSDFDGQPRLIGAAPDIGADEFFVAAPATPVVLDVFDPVARLLRLQPSTLAAAGRGPSLLAGRRRPTRTRVSYRLSEPARMRFTVQRRSAGRRVGRRCVVPNRRNRGRRRCVRYVTLRGSFTHQGAAGTNRFRFTGRLRRRKLAPARYRLVGVPTDAAGNRGRAVRARFRIVRR